MSSKEYENTDPFSLSNSAIGKFPEKVLQFGTGVLLKGLPDYLIQKANECGKFCGRIVMVKSTNRPRNPEESLPYHIFENGIQNKESHQQLHCITSVSREINANTEWNSILELATSPDLEVIISNTTEAGLRYEEESVFALPPQSYPAKLVAVLWARFQAGLDGLILIPCELIPDNGSILKELVKRQSVANNLSTEFITWLEKENSFCNSLVDRIVSGYPGPEEKKSIETKNGFEIQGLIESEPYLLWAIECGEEVRKKLDWDGIHPNWILQEDISVFRERKLRILNGTHTIMVALGILNGHKTVLECMKDPTMSAYIEQVALTEIGPATPVDQAIAMQFAEDVLDRFRNPHIRHILLNITLQYTMKMAMRNLATIRKYEEKFGKAPVLMAKGFAAYLHFINPVKEQDGKWFGSLKGAFYEIQDDQAGIFSKLRKEGNFPASVFGSPELWSGFPFSDGFKAAVLKEYEDINY